MAIIVFNLDKEKKKEALNEIVKLEIEYNTPLSTLILSEEDFEMLKKRERRIIKEEITRAEEVYKSVLIF